MKFGLLSAMGGVLAMLAPAMAQEAGMEARIEAYYANLVANPQELRALMEDAGPMPDGLWAVTERSYLPILADPAFVPYVVRRMPEFLAMGLTEEVALAAFAGLGDTGFLGADRLPPKKMETFFRSTIDLIDWLRDSNPEFCATMGAFVAAPTGTPDEDDLAPFLRLIATAVASFDGERVAALFRFVELVAEASLAEIRAYPEPRRLTPGPALASTAESYRAAFMARMSEAVGVQRAFDDRLNVDEMTPAVLCDTIILVFDAMWDLPPDQRETMLLAMLLAGTDPQAFEALMSGL